VGTRKESQENKEMITKFDVEKFSIENDFELWKLKMVDKGCGKGTKVVVKEQRLWRNSRDSTVTHNDDE